MFKKKATKKSAKKSTRKKATKRATKKATKRVKRAPQKTYLQRKIETYNALSSKALKIAEAMLEKAKGTKDSRMKKAYNRAAQANFRIADKAQKKAVEVELFRNR
jgi:hypothetical protein